MQVSGVRDGGSFSHLIHDWLAITEEALQLEYEGKERAAVEKWRELFGWRMPRP